MQRTILHAVLGECVPNAQEEIKRPREMTLREIWKKIHNLRETFLDKDINVAFDHKGNPKVAI